MSAATEEFPALLPEESFARAKTALSQLMTAAVRDHQPVVVNRNRGREHAVLVDKRDLERALESNTFNPKVSVSDDEFVVRLPEFNLIAGGATFDEAVAELVELAEDYSAEYLSRVDFYRQTDRRGQLGHVIRFALTPPEERRQLFVSAQTPSQTYGVATAR